MTHPADGAGPGTDLDEFKLIRVLGEGGMGAVYLGHDTLLDRQVAIKLIRGSVDSSDRARFLTEARAIARLSHPNVVAIYRAGTTRAGHPYLAQELIRGQTLAALPRPMPSRRACELGLGIARGLAAAHRRGILHRDIKPANVMVDHVGTPRLLDFGIAKLVGAPAALPAPGSAGPSPGASARPTAPLPSSSSSAELPATADLPVTPSQAEATRTGWDRSGSGSGSGSGEDGTEAGTIPGTPGYVAPELWAGEPASVRSDLWALGVVLYELVAGERPYPQTNFEALAAAVQLEAARPMAEVMPDVDPDVASLIARCLERDPRRRPESADELAFGLERILAGAPPVPDGNPYPGLAPFDASHRGVFYGRGADVSAVLDRLRGEPFVVIAGDSGVGKSSVCRAGIAPAVTAGGALADDRTWETRHVAVGRQPATALRDRLGLAADIVPTPSALAAAVAGDRTRGLLVVIDQLEELVTVADPAEAAAAAELVAALAADVPGVKLVLAVRGDFLTRVAALAALGPILTRGLYVLRGLDRAGARDAVVGPARAKAVAFGSDAMIDELIDSVAADPGSLPLLQFALAELWEHRDVAAGVIPAAALVSIGGVAGGLARHADGVLTGIAVADRPAARRLLLALVTRDGTRASRARAELAGDDPAAGRALEALVRGRLIVARDTVDGATYTLAHESLISAWGTLHGWLDDAAGQRGLRARISAAADEWHRLGRRGDGLWSRAQLREAAGLDDLAARDREFLAAGARATRRRLIVGLAIAAAIPIAAAGTWFGSVRAARRERDRNVATRVAIADRDLVTAEATAATAVAARREAIAAIDRGDAGGEVQWRAAQATGAAALRSYGDAITELEAALIQGGDRPDVRARIADALYHHALAAEAAGDTAGAEALIRRIVIYGGGAQLAAWHAPSRIAIDAPGARRIEIAPYVAGSDGTLALGPLAAAADAAQLTAELAPGSYRIELTGRDGLVVDDPVLLARGEARSERVPLPTAASIPDGFVYIPAGRFLLGSSGDDDVRRDFQFAAPIHPVETGAYLIGRTEVTFAQYLTYLRALSPEERARRRPPSLAGDGPFTLVLQPATQQFRAAEHAPLIYPGRTMNREQVWEQLPVNAISFEDAIAYAEWLASTGAVPGARLCTDQEWERAARGADGRRYPHGATLEPDDADIDVTYGRQPLAYGPDEVGAHPRSTSPFGVVDMTGNVWEVVRGKGDRPTLRGGSYYQGRTSALTTNHGQTEPTARPAWAGARICADPPVVSR